MMILSDGLLCSIIMARVLVYTFHGGGLRTEPESIVVTVFKTLPGTLAGLRWWEGEYIHLLLYSTCQMIFINHVHVRP